jgi:hypothetical protein
MLLVWCVLIGMVALLGIKVMPDTMEYIAIVKNIKATAQDPAIRNMNVAQIRDAFTKRAAIDNISHVKSADLEISKEGNEIVIAVDYERRIPLFGPAILLLNFKGSSAQ